VVFSFNSGISLALGLKNGLPSPRFQWFRLFYAASL